MKDLSDDILRVMRKEARPMDATTILDMLVWEGIQVPLFNKLYDVNEFFTLEEAQAIMWDNEAKGWVIRD